MAIPIDPRFIPAFSIEDVLLNKDTGAPLSGGLVYFYRDNQRGLLKPVYQITGTSPDYSFIALTNPVVLSSIGTFEDDLGNPVIPYFYPYSDGDNPEVELYYIKVTDSDGVEQFTREAQPYISNQTDGELGQVIINELSNPQFAQVNFDTTTSDYQYTFGAVTNQEINIAPDWDLVITVPSSGSVTVNQLRPSGSLNIPSNPSTLINISTAGVTSVILRQRLYGSPNLWGDGNIAASFVARTYTGTPIDLKMYYSQSDGTVTGKLLVNATLAANGNYASYPGNAVIPVSDSLDTFPDAYVDIYFVIPVNIEIDITSVMVAYTGDVTIENVGYDQESYERQVDHLFNYYEPQLIAKPIPSLLTGWDFPLNPFQFAASGTVTTTPAYICDQTIMASSSGTLNWTRLASYNSIGVTSTGDSQAFYMLQYLQGGQAFEMTLSRLAAYLNCYQLNHSGVVCKTYMYMTNSSGSIPALPTTIGTVAANGDFTLTAMNNWVEIPLLSGFSRQFTIDGTNSINEHMLPGFNGLSLLGSSTAQNFAIVVTFSIPTSGTQVVVNSVGLMAGDIATKPGAQSLDQVLAECQTYYEMSYTKGVYAGANSGIGYVAITCSSSWINNNAVAEASPFSVNFKRSKRIIPLVTLYSTDGTANNVLGFLYYFNGSVQTAFSNIPVANNWVASIGTNYASYIVTGVPTGTLVILGPSATGVSISMNSAGLTFHYVADARLGVV